MCEITDASRKEFMFFYDPDGQLIGEYRDNASTATSTDDWLVQQETIWLEDIPVAVIRKPTATELTPQISGVKQ